MNRIAKLIPALLMAAAFMGCNEKKPPQEPEMTDMRVRVDVDDMIPWWAPDDADYNVEVIKFKEPVYQQYILCQTQVQQDSVGSYLYESSLPAPVTPTEISQLAGESPYYDLGDGYAMVRFKWKEVLPRQYPLLDKKWEELEDLQQKFGREHVTVDAAIESFRYVPVYALDAYVGDSTVLPDIFSYATKDWTPDGIFYYGYFQYFFGTAIKPYRSGPYRQFDNVSPEEKEQYIFNFRQAEKAEERLAEIMRRMVAEGKLDQYTKQCFNLEDDSKSFAHYQSRYNCYEIFKNHKDSILVVF